MAQSGTVDRYDRIAVGYQRWWAPVIAPAALRLLDLVASTVVGRPGAHVVDVGSRARGPSPAPRSRAGRRSGHRGRTRAGDARGGGAGGGPHPRVVGCSAPRLADGHGRAPAARRRRRGRRCLLVRLPPRPWPERRAARSPSGSPSGRDDRGCHVACGRLAVRAVGPHGRSALLGTHGRAGQEVRAVVVHPHGKGDDLAGIGRVGDLAKRGFFEEVEHIDGNGSGHRGTDPQEGVSLTAPL